MRPVELQLEGFTTFRQATTVNFRDADLFVLTGPTGSGKSSIIDALVFALYGSVPRYGDRRSVEPVITLGRVQTRIRFDFTVGDDEYTVVRVVRRLKRGATTAEARLEHGDEVVASGADEVTEAVEKLLGLTYDHFIKAVVLPQGDFARFLHDRPSKRQELLRELLDLGIYRQIRDLAGRRKAAADAKVDLYRHELDGLGDLLERDEEAAQQRLQTLDALLEQVATAQQQIEALDEDLKARRTDIEDRQATVATLEAVVEPDGVEDLASRIRQADETVEHTKRAAAETSEAVAAQEPVVDSLPDPAAVENRLKLLEQRDRLTARQAANQTAVADAEQAVAAARADAEAAQAALTAAREHLQELHRRHAAHDLAAGVEVGEPCPVCGVTIETPPTLQAVPDLEEAEADVARHVATRDEAEARVRAAEADLVRATTALEQTSEQLATLEDQLEDVGSREELLALRSNIAAARERLETLKAAARAAAESAEEASRMRQALADEEARAWKTFHQVRDTVAHLKPPPAGRQDLAADWKALVHWAQDRADELRRQLAELEEQTADFAARRDRLLGDLEQAIVDAGLDVGPSPRDVVIEARSEVKHELEQLRSAKKRADELGAAVEQEQERSAVAGTLVRHLNAAKFEAWLLEEALYELTDGANGMLAELSGGAYSLEVVKNDFGIVDHRNADQHRSVKTLSGGETFLVSLALALSLSEQLANMSVHGTSKLESIFLDEGFGTLDQETLDVVASVVHELGASGRTVGLVSHVADLAEQVPVRFLVTKDASGSHVERIDA